MAFEVFDDVAFYWFFQVLLGIFLVPLTIQKLRNWLFFGRKKRKIRTHPVVKNIPDYIPTQKLVEDEIENRFSLSNIFFAALWVMFFLMLVQLPRWHNRQMTNFEPYQILGIERGATVAAIKRAYYKESLKYHPDINREAGAADRFILINKAYETLTNEETREKYEKYGNPDGYQGTHVTIGLPSLLTRKDNELVILVIYFSILVILVGIAWFWWKQTDKFHKSGVFKESIDIYWRYIKHNMDHKKLVDILSASSEYRIMDVRIPNDPANPKMKAIGVLWQEIDHRRKRAQELGRNEDMGNIFEASYVKKSCALLTAHLMGLPIPEVLNDEYLFVLQEAPRLLDVMIDMTLSRERFWTQGLLLIQVKQAIVQGVWPFEPQLKQLPHWTVGIEKLLRSKGYADLTQLNSLNPEKLRELLQEVYNKGSSDVSHLITDPQSPSKKNTKDSTNTEENNESKTAKELDTLPAGNQVTEEQVEKMVDHAEAMVRMYPVVQMKYCARTYDEKEVHEGDIVTVTVELNRLHEPWDMDLKKITAVEAMTPPEFDKSKKKEKEKEQDKKDGEYKDEDGLEFVEAEMDEKQRLQILRENAPVVHVNRFPFRVREKWMIMLVDKMIPAVIDQCAIPALTSKKIAELHFRIQRPAGVYHYALVAKCDSYLGADKRVDFAINVKPAIQVEQGKEETTNYGIPEEEEHQANPKWYYLWNETFWEFILTLFLLYFIYLVLVSTTWGKQYIQPCSDWVYDHAIIPVAAFMATKMSPVFSPIFTTIHDKTGVDIPKWWWGDEEKDKDKEDDHDNSESGTKEDM